VITDPLPRLPRLRREYEASDVHVSIPLPPAEPLQVASRALESALATGEQAPVARAGDALLDVLATFYEVAKPSLEVLGSRPHKVVEGLLGYELFGDYTLATQVIRVWMRTAVHARVTSYRGLLNTLLHEFCHHLDVLALELPDTPHTRGFYTRVDHLYHLALATPPDRRKPLVWIKTGRGWRVDWRKLRPTPGKR
jgi:hypothetical protein